MTLKQYIVCLLYFIIGCPIVDMFPKTPDDAGLFIIPWLCFMILWVLSCLGITVGTIGGLFLGVRNDN